MSFTDDVNNSKSDAQAEYDAELQKELDKIKAFRKSMEEEFSNMDPDDPGTHKKIREKLHELVPDAAETIALLMMHSDSDSVRANLAKFVFVEAGKSVTAEKPVDVLSQLFRDLANNDADVPS